ncbi:MAG: hypothetical protein LBS21_06910 [Clostridiales bacterium]|jgi:hypothetical protein|nr:hypothetical protein [Clostridiales bacterium]
MDNLSESTKAAKKRLQETLKQDPKLREAFKQSIDQLRKPENLKPMVESTARLFEALLVLQKAQKENEKR